MSSPQLRHLESGRCHEFSEILARTLQGRRIERTAIVEEEVTGAKSAYVELVLDDGCRMLFPFSDGDSVLIDAPTVN